jgi:acetyl esterase/lipase
MQQIIYIFNLLLLTALPCFSQKPLLDTGVFAKWPFVSDGAISPDGQYAFYYIEHEPADSRTLVICSIDGRTNLQIVRARSAVFSRDSREVIFSVSDDSLGIATLDNGTIAYTARVSSFKVIRHSLAYTVATPGNGLVLRNLQTWQERSFDGVTEYTGSDSSGALVLRMGRKDTTQAVIWVDSSGRQADTIWRGASPGNFVLSADGRQLAFFSQEPADPEKNTIWYYEAGMGKAMPLTGHKAMKADTGLVVARLTGFSEAGDLLFIHLQEKSRGPHISDPVKVNVWSYHDARLQSEQLNELHSPYLAGAISLQGPPVVRQLQRRNETRIRSINERWGLFLKREGNFEERNWNRASQSELSIVDLRTGERNRIGKLDGMLPANEELSPGGKFIIYYSPQAKSFFRYDITEGSSRNLTSGTQTIWPANEDQPIHAEVARGIAGWVAGDSAVLLYDRWDIWLVNLYGPPHPVNLTNGYGRRNDAVFRLGLDYGGRSLGQTERLILSAFNRRNKENGFYSKQLDLTGDPDSLTMGPWYYYAPGTETLVQDGSQNFRPRKAAQADAYLVRRMSEKASSNYLLTKDFKIYIPISDVHPERNYRWLTSQLVSWKTLDGKPCQGVLYKPEDFDAKRKYPVIFYFYESVSDGLHIYHAPDFCGAGFNIPWLVNKGYLVFTPDIQYTLGYPGRSAYNAIVSAADYLKRSSWIDSTKLGLVGHSFGGYEVNYVITHTARFAAAVSSSAVSDEISASESLWSHGESQMEYYERRQGRIGKTLWERPDLYVDNSPIFLAHRVATPVLLLDNPNDMSVPFAQGVAFFTALRRLGKTAWMLEYEGEGHGLNSNNRPAIADYTTRMLQFLDYYLKKEPAPRWMVEGIPASEKGRDRGLELEPAGKAPGRSLLMGRAY